MDHKIIEKLKAAAGEQAILLDEKMSAHTTFRIGGPADVFAVPENAAQAARLMAVCREEGVPYFILGNGSNLLVSDEGFRGVVIQIYKNMCSLSTDGVRITAQAGAALAAVASAARDASLTGLEFASGIPGTVGGAVVMNAGAYGGEIRNVLESAAILTKEGEFHTLPVSELRMGYRTSVIKEKGYTVLEAVFRLEKGDPEEIRGTMAELQRRRIEKQPLEYPSAGSTFKRPEGYFAGKLIMDAGFRGHSVGDACVSEKHCGFVINRGHATAEQVRALMREVSDGVYARYGVRLEPEVQFLGNFAE